MTILKFASYSIEPGTDHTGRSYVYLICPQCPGIRNYFADEIERRVSIGELFQLASNHHNERYRSPHLLGDDQ